MQLTVHLSHIQSIRSSTAQKQKFLIKYLISKYEHIRRKLHSLHTQNKVFQ